METSVDFVVTKTCSVPSRSSWIRISIEECVNFVSVAADTCLASRCLAMECSGFQASCHNIMYIVTNLINALPGNSSVTTRNNKGSCVFCRTDRRANRLAESESYVTTDIQSASLSWYKVPIWGLRPDFYCRTEYGIRRTVAGLLIWGALSDETTGLSFAIASGPSQSSHSRVRVPWDSRPYLLSQIWDFFCPS
jgi:hypothetical protein